MAVEKTKGKLDVITNIMTIMAAIIVIAVAVHNYVLPTTSTSKEPKIGGSITVPDFDPTDASKNVLVVMMKGCPYCEKSMDFYRELLLQNKDASVKFFAVFPPGSDDVEGYLQTHGVSGIQVKYSKLSAVDVGGTPTIIVTDSSGTIIKSWVGKLSPEKEREVTSFLNS